MSTSDGFPIESLLTLYSRAHKRDVYCDYFKGFKLLLTWLGPIAYPDIEPIPIPWYVRSYELQELARHLEISQQKLYTICERINHGLESNSNSNSNSN